MARSEMQTPRMFKVALLVAPEDRVSREKASHVREVLSLIQDARPGIRFVVSEHRCGSGSETLQACLDSDAILLCGHDAEDSISMALSKELDASATIQPVSIPSTALLREDGPTESVNLRNLDITFVSGQRGERDSRDMIERIARWAGEHAMRFQPPKAVHVVDASTSLWNTVASEVLQKHFSRVPIDSVPVDVAAALVDSRPTQLNGIVISRTGASLAEKVRNIVEFNDLLPSATISLSQRSDQADSSLSRGVFKAGDFSTAHEEATCILPAISLMLDLSLGLHAEAAAITKAIRRTLDPVELLGSNMRTPSAGGTASPHEFMQTFTQHLDTYLEAARALPSPEPPQHNPHTSHLHNAPRPRPMSVIEKILTHAAVGLTTPTIQPGEIICAAVSWTLTSEILWAGMEKTYAAMGRPKLHRTDRTWLALDHTLDPRTNHLPRQRGLIEKAEAFRREAKLVDFVPANTSILHTDFTRDRALPGQIVVGADSHTCSAGCVGALAVGLGAADVVMPMVTGETWFRVPEVCRINFEGRLGFGISGKDVILHILRLFKRNTIAFQRAVEYGGPGLSELSMDARFAIANMTTEFGGMGACFEGDERTAAWIGDRPHGEHRGGLYFRADAGAEYAEVRAVDLGEVEWTVALHPNPDDVVPVSEKEGMRLDGCFIGACTTTEEDLITAALVLDAGLRSGLVPVSGRRRVTPGSLSIIKNLERHGLLDIYRAAGFDIGAPGCSYCVGINDVDVALEGEVWLSSQNRNFRNRMGKGSIGHVTCAAVVAASSFGMAVADPRPLLGQIDKARLDRILGRQKVAVALAPTISEPEPVLVAESFDESENAGGGTEASPSTRSTRGSSEQILQSRVQRFGENVDTDAIIPAEFVPGVDNADLGSHCFQYYRPEFRQRAKDGAKIIVADRGFGSGSSREDAVRALQGAGIEAVIAPSFAFIYDRNQLNMGLFSITLQDDAFYAHVQEDSVVIIDREKKIVRIDGLDQAFAYQQSEMEKTLLEAGGVLPLYSRFGRAVFRGIARANTSRGERPKAPAKGLSGGLEW
ncbi:Aconitase dehydratase large subunit, alpha subdomain 1 [Aspergillus mulundensis]|uniref:Aconitase dehydratase large subunit, alpha subdomain 1 n=1 Tax=Aspergillus mulundensis TaxID=1810919 RepID=A0A3D8QH89_9EURO|nr:Aconitase dehydratase large subunit, alpha subdomain 1 [Aspergillus mulundensis]RDW61206.1 Aconitase dehydratase large subunit, alpha subdomain 1 [Aspergillus mulundensis]